MKDISWEELNTYVSILLRRVPYMDIWGTPRFDRDIWRRIILEPFNPDSIDRLTRQGWKVVLDDLESDGYALPRVREILLNRRLGLYQRDLTLFHELMHAWFGDELGGKNHVMDHKLAEESEAIAEWLARQYRADPELLRHTVLSFGLEPGVYDCISYEAFYPDLIKQGVLPSVAEYYREQGILMYVEGVRKF